MPPSCTVSEISSYSEILVENRQFEPKPPPIGAPVGDYSLEFCRDVWRQKTRVPVLSCGVVCVILRLDLLVQCRLVTDRQTDRRTHDDSKHASIASCGKSCTDVLFHHAKFAAAGTSRVAEERKSSISLFLSPMTATA